MAKIRDDLDGVVYVGGEFGTPVALAAGDDVPKGFTVGAHLLNGDSDEPMGGRPKGNGSREDWADYATSLGIDVPGDAKQKDIRDLVAAHDATQE